MSTWAIVRLASGTSATPAIRGNSYSCVINDPDTATGVGDALCTEITVKLVSINESGCPTNAQYVYSSGTRCRSTCGPPSSYLSDEVYCNLCPDGTYSDGTSCLPCDVSCATCTGSSATQCVLCKAGLYRYPNSTCASCSSLFATTIPTNILYCDYPCSSTEVVFVNRTCKPTCPLPFSLVIDSNPICTFPCALNSYLYPDSTCKSTCDLPLVIKLEGNVGFYCVSPCQNSNEFYHPDTNTCDTTCPPSFSVTTLAFYKVCSFPCDSKSYL